MVSVEESALNTHHPALRTNRCLESGLVHAFRIVLGLRLLLWVLLTVFAEQRPMPVAFELQTIAVTVLSDSLLLFVLSWPSLHRKIGPRQFGWLLAISSAALFYGHASALASQELAGALLVSIVYSPHSIFLSMNILFVAWQYDLRAVVLYGSVVLGMLLLLLWQPELLAIDRSLIVALTIITISVALITMLLPGWLISHLMNQQRQQQAALARAAEEQACTNQQLVHYAASLEELTISRERNRLARELHDTLAFNESVFVRWETPRSGPHPPTPAPVQSGATDTSHEPLTLAGAGLTGAGGPGNGVLGYPPRLPGRRAIGTRFREPGPPHRPDRHQGRRGAHSEPDKT
jgi:hypothetical protein